MFELDPYLSHLSGNFRTSVNLKSVFAAFVVIVVVNRIWVFIHRLRAVHYLPGYRPLFSPLTPPGLFLPTTWWNTSFDVHWFRQLTIYAESETISIVPTLKGGSTIWTSSLNVARQVASGGNRTVFIKPKWSVEGLCLWGVNLVAADGEVWRKHRRVMGPAFNNELYRLVWTETLKTYREMITVEKWEEKEIVNVPVIQSLTFKLALQVLGKCSFGLSFSWDDPPQVADGGMSIQEALRIVADTNMLQVFAPKWVLRLPFRKIQQSNIAHESLTMFMKEQVAARKVEVQDSNSKDAFTLLVKANEQEETKNKLSDDELIGNVYIMLFAGHETTAYTLAATLGLLALNQDSQDEVLQQIEEVIGHDRDPEIEDYHSLNKVLAAFFEASRLFPSGHLLIREANEDTIIQIPNPRGQEGNTSMAIPKGQVVVLDMVGIHRNPRYFEDPMSYKPSRWHGINNDSEDFTVFSIGPRACIGRKFATTEVVCFLSMLLRDWKVLPKLKANESQEEWKIRVLDAKPNITLAVSDVPLTFVRRK